MRKLKAFFRGKVRLSFEGEGLTVFLNQLAKRELHFWDILWEGEEKLSFTVGQKDARLFQNLAKEANLEISIRSHWGLPFFLGRFRRRYALVVGGAFLLVALLVSSKFVWHIEILGCDAVSDEAIRSVLRQHGLDIGSYIPNLEARTLNNELLLAVDEIGFCAVNIYGSKVEVVLREKDILPPLVVEHVPTNIVATTTGIVTAVEVLEGQEKCEVGDMVIEGDILISAEVEMEAPEYSGYDNGYYLSRGDGRVYARTFPTLVAQMPLTASIKEPTGEGMTLFSVNILGRWVKFYGNGGISYETYDKISEKKILSLSESNSPALSLELSHIRAYTTVEVDLVAEEVEKLLKESLHETLLAQVGEDGEIYREDYVTKIVDGVMEVTLVADCHQQIGALILLSEEEILLIEEKASAKDSEKEENEEV